MNRKSALLRTTQPANGDGHTSGSGLQFVPVELPAFESQPKNLMSVDVEDYFQVSAFEHQVTRDQWSSLPSRLKRNVDRILELFDEADVKATFFVLGWVGQYHPDVVRAIADNGHEVASHGFGHHRVWTQTRKQYFHDVSSSRRRLEDIAGIEVIGYRAPSFSIDAKSLWAYDALQEAGYKYSSSIYPIRHDHYGVPNAPRFPFRHAENGILEVPLSTIPFAGRNWPCAGGGYFRLLPLKYSRWAIRRINDVEKKPANFYFHPWELDPSQPRVSGISLKARFRHYVNLNRFERRLTRILEEYRWGRMDQALRDVL